jgi:hypothetical protein
MRILVVALAIALLLSGCATKKDDGDGDSSSTKSSSNSGTGTAGNGTRGVGGINHPPAATLKANATDSQAPINVTFAINATDADADPLTWRLAFGDNASANGTFASPGSANVTHKFTSGGLYNATLSVSDGKVTTNVSVLLNITSGSPFEKFTASGTPDLACAQCSEAGANTGIGYRAGVNELDSWFVTIPEGAAGQPFTVSAAEDVDMVFRDVCEEGAAVGETFQADGDEAGIVPEGATCVLAWLPGAVGETITLTIG